MVLLTARVSHLLPPDARKYVGDFISPRAYNLVGQTPIWAADNDAFSGFHAGRYCRMLDRIGEAVRDQRATPPMFITVPDVVGCHSQTLDLWYHWTGEIRTRGLTPAFVLQNGCEDHWHYWLAGDAEEFPWEQVNAFFIGGDTAFKFSAEVREIVAAAHYHGKWVHMGRVNSVKRMLYAHRIGCDSCDGSGMAKFPSSHLPPMIRALETELHTTTHQLALSL